MRIGATSPRGGKAVLAIAHPGHELRLTQWVEMARPIVHVLTAGSRHGDAGRVEGSHEVLSRLGATPGALFGRYLDRDVYGWVMAGEAWRFVALAEELADSFVRDDVSLVVFDSWQFYDPLHDIWHLMVRAAGATAAAALGRPIRLLDFEVVPPAMAGRGPGPVWADDELSAETVEAVLDLAAAFPGIAEDVTAVLATGGRAFLARETFHEPRPLAELVPKAGEAIPYEVRGEAKVASGAYVDVLRWSHVEVVIAALAPMLGGVRPVA